MSASIATHLFSSTFIYFIRSIIHLCSVVFSHDQLAAAQQAHSDSPEGTSGGSGETLARSNGWSAIINDDMASQLTETSIMDDIHIPSELSHMDVDLGPPTQALG